MCSGLFSTENRTVEMPAKYIVAHTCNAIVYVGACAMCAVCMFMCIQKHCAHEQIHVSMRVEARG